MISAHDNNTSTVFTLFKSLLLQYVLQNRTDMKAEKQSSRTGTRTRARENQRESESETHKNGVY